MVQAKLWCPWTGGLVWVRSDIAHEFIAAGNITLNGEVFPAGAVVPVRFIRAQVGGVDQPAAEAVPMRNASDVGISDFSKNENLNVTPITRSQP